MATGDLYIALEPDGYFYPEEEGASFTLSGHDFRNRAITRDVDNFFIAPGSPWICPKVRQFDDKWTAEENRDEREPHIHLYSNWSFHPDTIHRQEYLDARLIGVAADPLREWIYIRTPAEEDIEAGPVLHETYLNYAGEDPTVNTTVLRSVMAIEAKVKLPWLYVVAVTNDLMPGRKAPFIRTSLTPSPHDVVVFGIGLVAFVVLKGNIHVLKRDEVAGRWRYCGEVAESGKPATFRAGIRTNLANQAHEANAMREYDDVRNISFIEFGAPQIGYDEVWLGGKGWGKLIRIDKQVETYGPKTDNSWGQEATLGRYYGKWWVAIPADEEVYFQLERCAYNVAQHVQDEDMVVPPELGAEQKEPLMFNFGPGYAPTPEPEHFCDCLIHGPPNEEVRLEYENDGMSVGETWHNAGGFGEEIHYRIIDNLYLPWVASSSRKQYSGRVHLKLTPADDFESAPQVRLIIYKWDPVLAPRTRYLSDWEFLMIGATDVLKPTEWNEFRISASMLDPESKQFECIYEESYENLLFTGTRWLSKMEPYEGRTGFPVEIWRERDNGAFDVVGRAWVTKIEKQEPMLVAADLGDTEGLDPKAPIRRWRIIGRGLTRRMRQPWAFTPAVDSPVQDGRVTHPQAVKQACLQTGFKDDPETIDFDDDPGNFLPGDIRSQSGASEDKPRKTAFHPDWNQLKLDFVMMIALGWSGWNFYEPINGVLHYKPDVLVNRFLKGINPSIDTTFYADRLDAIAAGTPNHVWLSDPAPERFVLEIQANVVRVTGKGKEADEFAQIIVKDLQSIRGPATYENFHGEPKVVVVHVDIAVNEDAAGHIAFMMLDRFRMRGELLRWRVPMPAWDVRSPTHPQAVDVGHSAVVQHHGNFVVVHSEVDVLNVDEKYTNYTGWLWPTPINPVLEAE